MGKTAPLKHDSKSNPRSRASKRATSPSINMDKSLKSIPRVTDATKSLLAPRPESGVLKHRRSRPKSHAQKVRQEKLFARAETVGDKMDKKVDGSKRKHRRRRARKATWDEVNGTGKEERKNAILSNGIEITEEDADTEPENVNKAEVEGEDDSGDSDVETLLAQLQKIREAPMQSMTSSRGPVAMIKQESISKVDDEGEIT